MNFLSNCQHVGNTNPQNMLHIITLLYLQPNVISFSSILLQLVFQFILLIHPTDHYMVHEGTQKYFTSCGFNEKKIFVSKF